MSHQHDVDARGVMMKRQNKKAYRSILLMMLIASVMLLSGCDGRLMATGHIVSLLLTCGMLWATLNMDKVR